MRLRELWKILTTPPESAVSACSAGVPLSFDEKYPDVREIAEAAMKAAAPLADEDGPGEEDGPWAEGWEFSFVPYNVRLAASEQMVRKVDEEIMKLVSDADVIREVRVTKPIKVGDYEINPVSGIPYTDKERKEWQLDTFMFEYFPDAWLAVVQVAVAGNKQHNPGQPLHWAREKSKDQFNTAFRHYWERRRGVWKDTDGQYHLAKSIWRQMAQLQLDIEADRKKEST